MWRHVAAALFCAYFTFVGLPLFFDLISDAPAPLRVAMVTQVTPRVVGHVRAVPRQESSAAFAAIGITPPILEAVRDPEWDPPAATITERERIFRAFDPDIYRSGRVGEPLSVEDTCEVVADAAAEHKIPPALFARLIWQESRFRREAVSRAGAQGIAQFMPATAAERGLDDPFDPLQALPASAQFLRHLTDRFGNFGLAAAAYNGGPQRVSDWLAGRGDLPKETRDYVLRITGQHAEYWAKSPQVRRRSDKLAKHICALTLIPAPAEKSAQNRR
jgi:hypothetical protein